jgi:hypothetical protein
MGLAVGTGADLVKQGKVGFPEIQKAIALLTDEGGKFHNFMAKQNKSLFGQLSNLQDRFEILAIKVGEGGLLPAAKGYIKAAIKMIKTNEKMIVKKLVTFFKDLQDQLIGMINFGIDVVAFVLNLIEGFGGLKNALMAIIGVWTLFNLQLVLVAVGILGLFLLLEDLFVAFKGGKALTSGLVKPLTGLADILQEMLGPVVNELKKLGEGFFEIFRSEEFQKIAKIVGGILVFAFLALAKAIQVTLVATLALINALLRLRPAKDVPTIQRAAAAAAIAAAGVRNNVVNNEITVVQTDGESPEALAVRIEEQITDAQRQNETMDKQ